MKPFVPYIFLIGGVFGLSCTRQQQNLTWVETTLASMSVEEKVGQLFVEDLVAVYSSNESPITQYAKELIHRYHVGSFILAGGTATDVALMTNALQRESKIPLLINADLENGMSFAHPWRWVRGRAPELPRYIRGGGTAFPSQMAIGATGNPQFAYQMGRITAQEARAVGIHWTNSPVADVNNNPNNPIINTRSFGENPDKVAQFVDAYVRGLQEGNVMATLKHFPGHGDTQEDTHMELPVLPFDEARLDTVELVPFRAGIAAGAKAIMTAHLALPKMDSTNHPATLSRPIVTGLLRQKLGFTGVVVTDGMTMQGITDHYGADEAAVLAIEAGVDAILVPADFDKAYNGVLDAVKSGRITETRLDQSVRRILTAKSWVGLDRARRVDLEKISSIVGTPQSGALSDTMYGAAVTLLRNHQKVLPLTKRDRVHIIVVSEEFSTTLGEELEEVLRPHVASVSMSRLTNESGTPSIHAAMREASRSDAVVLGVYHSIGAWKGSSGFSSALEKFFTQLARSRQHVITVAFGDPYVLGKLPLTDAVLIPYSGTREAERAIGRAVTGQIDMRGKLPVTIPRRFKRDEGIEFHQSQPVEG